ncbi:tetratricopeptide repeat protein [Erythrobacter crassostreae]|uniref:Tetratricopeptide repeat protein n=1 Tax=Erythrobacter crassostreae TaxID=2828328 RepID=A0A9X1F543_9SPHN|nr:tetratricopeptide repeat protein [Erythrobacter crassostrea]MBV7258980.1 tetratricopeptide repeat protein [Erythrobacter crassostrea]
MTKLRKTSTRSMMPAAALALVTMPFLAACDTAPADPMAAAQAALADGTPRIALEYVNAALSADPDNAELRMMAGDLALAVGNPDRAVTEFEAIVGGPNSSSLAQAKLAEAYLLGNYMGAAREALETLEYDVPMAYTAAIGIAMADGDMPLASSQLDKGLEKFPDDPRLVTIDAERLMAAAQSKAALERLAPVLLIEPAVPQAHMLAGQIALADRALDTASKRFETVLSVHPAHQTAMLGMAAIARDKGDKQKAADWIQKTGGSGTTHPIGVLFLAQMSFNDGDMQGAFELIETVPAAIAAEPAFTRLRGFIDAARGQHGSAILALDGYAEDHPSDLMAQRVLAQSFAEEGEFANAWNTISRVVDHPQADGGTLLLALRLAEETGQSDAAKIRTLIAKRDAAPDLSEAMLDAGRAIRTGDWAKADSIYAPLIDGSGKNDPALLNNAAAVKTKLGEHDAAVSLARRALAQAPQSPQVLDTLGWALWQKGGAKAEARALLTKARQGAPNNGEIAAHWTAAHADN